MGKDDICQVRVQDRLWKVQLSFFTGCYDLISGREAITVKANATFSEIIQVLMGVQND